jgi:hypothetical protein
LVGDDLYLPVDGLVKGGVAVNMTGDAGNVDPQGATIDIRGDIQAPTVAMQGGPNLDFFQIISASGINASGSTTISGLNGDDRFFIQALAAAMTINGGAGADRFHISSNASKELFDSSGFNDDDPLPLLTGTLANIKYALTINTGDGGAGGTRDAIYASAGGSTGSLNGVLDVNSISGYGTITGLGMPGHVDFSAPSAASAYVFVGLGESDDVFDVKAAANNIVAVVSGRAGDDTLNVTDGGSLSRISGIVAFEGDTGNDTLQVSGNATANVDSTTGFDPDQLTAIGITGLEMGVNSLYFDHASFGAAVDSGEASYPGAIYYATRTTTNSVDTINSTVEAVNVQFGGGDDTFTIDSAYDHGTTTIRGGGGNDIFTVGSTPTGLRPASPSRVDFVDGALALYGEAGTNTVVVDDSGEADNLNIGTFDGNTVTGLDMTGTLTFHAFDTADVRLGLLADTFYVASTDTATHLLLATGPGTDKVYVGTTTEDAGSLDSILGDVSINGQGPEDDDQLFFNDQSSTTATSWIVNNATSLTFDVTTVSRVGSADVEYPRME